MKSIIFILSCLAPLFVFSQEHNIGAVRFTNFQVDNRNVILFDEADAVVDEVFLPEEGQGVVHELVSGEYCAQVFIQPKKGDARLDGLESDQIYETEFSVEIITNKETRILLQNITKFLSLKAID